MEDETDACEACGRPSRGSLCGACEEEQRQEALLEHRRGCDCDICYDARYEDRNALSED
jgi:hypothetical protein